MEFKNSNLIARLSDGNMLSQDAWDFVDACMDDFCVDEWTEGKETGIVYEIRAMMHGHHNGRPVEIVQIYEADIDGMAAIIEHLALTQKLLMEHNGFGIDYIEEENRK